MKIAILDDYQNLARSATDWSALDAQCGITVFHDTLDDPVALATRLAPFDILCVMRERTPIPASLQAQLPNLKLIVTTGKRNDAIDVAAAQARGITVCGTESPSTATPELTFALMLALARGIVPENKSVREGGWQVGLGHDLAGSTLGIIGLGRLGEKVATIAQAFGMNIIAWSENLTSERCAKLGVTLASKQDLLRQSDFITIHQRLSDRTTGLIGADELNLMKPTAFLINTSRGPIVDWQALLVAVEKGQIAGAGIDVYDTEPLPHDHPLRGSNKLLLTPHLGYVTRGTWNVFYGQTVDAITAWLAGKPIRVIPA
ncbi:D-2-hydroxyacid dehydrogenase family protein [Thalassospira sp.]|uniref:D-2-hydroxyacid dehydrogenase family protein n=1 Tax=Thalassospira sp. TaxID=1912094 RepID=UPI002733712C|nr:D-2-hydroxyacid dehydrogenase family protein [Thalassospira sp.]MDP2699142.1 D-2-hydroxyacid dehydrogenase family protein [Thalassospira sp.]